VEFEEFLLPVKLKKEQAACIHAGLPHVRFFLALVIGLSLLKFKGSDLFELLP